MSDLNVAKVEALLDELIDADPDKAERFISERLARVELRKRLQQKKEGTMTLLERFDKMVADAWVIGSKDDIEKLRRADELLRGEK